MVAKRGMGLGGHNRLVCGVLLCVLVASLVTAFAHRGNQPKGLHGDQVYYEMLGDSLRTKHTYAVNGQPHTYEAPAYPALVALVYAVAGRSLYAVYLVQALMLVLTALLLYSITMYITGVRATALIALCICAVWVPFYETVSVILTENMSILAVTASTWFLLKTMRAPSIWLSLATGVLIAIAALAKAVFLPFLAAALVFVAFAGENRRRSFVCALVMLLGAGAFIVPWTVRNYAVTGRFVPVSTAGPYCFWMGNHPDIYSVPRGNEAVPARYRGMLRRMSPEEADRYFIRQGMNYIAEDPVRAVVLFAVKFDELWLSGFGRHVRGLDKNVWSIGSFGIPKRSLTSVPLFLAAVFGYLWMPAAARKRSRPLLVLLALWALSYVVIYSESRYVLPVQPLEMLFAAVSVHAVVSRLSGRKMSENEVAAE